jgi:hypothetical protein
MMVNKTHHFNAGRVFASAPLRVRTAAYRADR